MSLTEKQKSLLMRGAQASEQNYIKLATAIFQAITDSRNANELDEMKAAMAVVVMKTFLEVSGKKGKANGRTSLGSMKAFFRSLADEIEKITPNTLGILNTMSTFHKVFCPGASNPDFDCGELEMFTKYLADAKKHPERYESTFDRMIKQDSNTMNSFSNFPDLQDITAFKIGKDGKLEKADMSEVPEEVLSGLRQVMSQEGSSETTKETPKQDEWPDEIDSDSFKN